MPPRKNAKKEAAEAPPAPAAVPSGAILDLLAVVGFGVLMSCH